VTWTVLLHPEFDPEFEELEEDVQDELLALMQMLSEYGPSLGRPHVDTLSGSKHTNLNELRFKASGGVWRVAFAFDPERQAVVLVAGDKSGVSQDRFYRALIKKAETRFDQWLSTLAPKKEK
jgi:hypothetical protein